MILITYQMLDDTYYIHRKRPLYYYYFHQYIIFYSPKSNNINLHHNFIGTKLLAMIYPNCNPKLCQKKFVNGWPRPLPNRRLAQEGRRRNGLRFDLLPMLFVLGFSSRKSTDECPVRN